MLSLPWFLYAQLLLRLARRLYRRQFRCLATITATAVRAFGIRGRFFLRGRGVRGCDGHGFGSGGRFGLGGRKECFPPLFDEPLED